MNIHRKHRHNAAQSGPDTGRTIARVLAEFTLGLTISDIPRHVRECATQHILDGIGIAYASSRHEFARCALAGLRSLDQAGRIPIIGMNARLSARDAAVMNGVLVHGLDYDDTHQASVMHATASILPTILSAGYDAKFAGTDLLSAYVAGMETGIRLGLVAGRILPPLGFHPTSVFGVFGCVIAAGRLAGIDAAELVMAQGIALSMACGNLECHEEGAWTKRLHPGWAAHSAMTAVALAKAGFTGASKPYEGRFSVFNTFAQQTVTTAENLARITADLGEKWHIADVAVKPIPACHWSHGCIDAAIALRQKHDLDARDIVAIRALVPAGVVKAVCEPLAEKRRPRNAYAAQFSLPYVIAVGFLEGRFTLRDLEDDRLNDPEILRLCDLTTYEIDDASTFPVHYTGEVHVHLSDGRCLKHREAINRGSSERPLSRSDIVGKFRENIDRILAPAAAQDLVACVTALETEENAVHAIDRLCGAAGHPRAS